LLPLLRRPSSLAESFSLGATPTTREAQAIADEIFADFVSAEADKVELVFTKFVSLINSVPTVQTLLPMTPTGELCDLDGKCVDAADDEMFKLTTQVRVCYLLVEVACYLLLVMMLGSPSRSTMV
jgi:F-type H+-transporting ATPase subunit gamma